MTHASLSFVQTYLREAGISPRKSHSQNFLIDGNIAQKIVQQLAISENDFVIEVGPGLGALTEWILQKSSHLIAIEKDPHLIPALSPLSPPLTILQGDILDLEWNDFLENNHQSLLISNLPYHISKEFFQKLYQYHSRIKTALILVQKEFAEKLTSLPHTPEYRYITVFCRLFCDITPLFDIPPHLFYPRAGIYSRLIKLEIKRDAPPPEGMKLLELSFMHRRKSILNSLKDSNFDTEKVAQALKSQGKTAFARAEELSPEMWGEVLRATFN